MPDILAISLQTSVDHALEASIDSCYSLQALFTEDCTYALRFSDSIATLSDKRALSTTMQEEVSLTIVSGSLSLRKLAQVLNKLLQTTSSANNEVRISCNRFAKDFTTQAIDVAFGSKLDFDKALIAQTCAQYRVDIFEKRQARFDTPGLLVMDMDSTIIAMECIDEIAALAGVKDQVAAVTERAMQGEIAFTQSLHDRVACLAGIAVSDLNAIRERLPFMPNFVATMDKLKEAGWKLVVASGGFTFFADYVKHIAGLDAAYSNRLDIQDGKLTGKVIGEVVDGAAKASILVSMSKQFRIDDSQTVAIGDGANDLLMMEKAALSVAYHAKPAVAAAASSSIRYVGFEGLLFSLR